MTKIDNLLFILVIPKLFFYKEYKNYRKRFVMYKLTNYNILSV